MQNMHKILAMMMAILLFSGCYAQNAALLNTPNGFTIAFYNVENLFDTIRDPSINDLEFLPDSKVPWTSERYTVKLDNISRVIAAMDTLDFPHLIGLSEVENMAVLSDLAANKTLKDANYSIVHIEGNDPRGIEVALMYRHNYFRVLHSEAVQVESPDDRPIRHILYIKGIKAPNDTLHVFVNHWTSRFGGSEQTIPARIASAKKLRSVVDSLLLVQPMANIIIGGDFNDNPDDASLFSHLRAYAPDDAIRPANLYNLAMEPWLLGQGTLYYRSWDFFDQIIVSSALLDGSRLTAGPIQVIKRPWMLYTPPQGGEARPNRTASGSRYFGGYSDHLPVMVRLH
jgi:endonuclease/exonuclease/phosphatase family metal-dependent hydrolase